MLRTRVVCVTVQKLDVVNSKTKRLDVAEEEISNLCLVWILYIALTSNTEVFSLKP